MIAKTPDIEREERANKLQKLLRSGGGWTSRELWIRLGAHGDVPALERLLGELCEDGEAHLRDGRWFGGPGKGRPLMQVDPPRPARAVGLERTVEPLPPRSVHPARGAAPQGRWVAGRFVVGALAQDDGAAGERAGAPAPLSGWSPELPAETARALLTDPVAAPAAAVAACQHPVSTCSDLAHLQAVVPTESGEADPGPAGTLKRAEGEVGVTAPSAAQLPGGSSNGRTGQPCGVPESSTSEECRDAGSSPAPPTSSSLSGRVIEILRLHPGLTAPDVHEALAEPGRALNTTHSLLISMEKRGYARREGRGRGQRWYLVSPDGPGMPSAKMPSDTSGSGAEPAAAGASKEAGTRPEGQQTGFDKPPSHYDGGQGLEAIDRIWRLLRTIADDAAMVAFCVGNALKYEMRAGRKTDGDHEKARWYWQFASYIRGEGPDPRITRPGFVPHPDAPRPMNRSR